MNIKDFLTEKLVVGAKVKFGKKYSQDFSSKEETIELVEGHFEHYNGLYTVDEIAPAFWDGSDFQSIYHLFGNDLENFMDCEIIEPETPSLPVDVQGVKNKISSIIKEHVFIDYESMSDQLTGVEDAGNEIFKILSIHPSALSGLVKKWEGDYKRYKLKVESNIDERNKLYYQGKIDGVLKAIADLKQLM